MAYCTFCGNLVSESVATCPKCGHPQSAADVATPSGFPSSTTRRTEGTAVASLILGIAGLIVCPFIPSIIAVILGSQARTKIAADPELDGDPLAKAGVILGWVGIGLGALLIIGAVLLIALGGMGSLDRFSDSV